jgi:hypothetical protein
MNAVFMAVVTTLREAMNALPWDQYKALIAKLHKTLTEEMERIR